MLQITDRYLMIIGKNHQFLTFVGDIDSLTAENGLHSGETETKLELMLWSILWAPETFFIASYDSTQT